MLTGPSFNHVFCWFYRNRVQHLLHKDTIPTNTAPLILEYIRINASMEIDSGSIGSPPPLYRQNIHEELQHRPITMDWDSVPFFFKSPACWDLLRGTNTNIAAAIRQSASKPVKLHHSASKCQECQLQGSKSCSSSALSSFPLLDMSRATFLT